MSIEPKIMARLKLTVPSVADRVYWLGALQGATLPYLTLSEISPGREYSHDGYSGIKRPRWQVSVFGSNYVQAKQTAEEVVAGMESWQADGVRVATVAGQADLYEEDTKIYHVPVSFFIHYEE